VAALASCAAAGPDSIKDAAAAALDECAADVASGLVSAVGALERAGQARVRSAAAAYERSGGEEEAQLLFDVRAPLARLLALLQLGGGGAAEDDEVHDALSALLEVSRQPYEHVALATAARRCSRHCAGTPGAVF
jgi:hypothetical protein